MRSEKVEDINVDYHYVGRMEGWRIRAMVNVNVMISGSVCQKVMGDVRCKAIIAK